MTGATSPQATTSTPANSEDERPREEPFGIVERYDALFERKVFRDELSGATALIERPLDAKVSSPELASLAAEYLALSDFDLAYRLADPSSAVDVKRLAASVLAQAEGTPRK